MAESPPRPYLFFSRACGFALLLAVAVMVANLTLPSSPRLLAALLPEVAEDAHALDRTEGIVAYLGDSVVGWRGPDDPRQTQLPFLLARSRGLDVMDLHQGANGPEVFLAQLRYLRRNGIRPQACLVPINLRSFGPHWENFPPWNFGMRCDMLETGLYLQLRGAAVLKYDWGRLDDDAFRAITVVVAGSPLATLGELDRPPAGIDLATRSRRKFLAQYATDVRRSRRWQVLPELFAELARCEFPTLVYLTPVDLDGMRSHLSEEEVAGVRDNLTAIRKLAAEHGVELLDLSAALPHPAFEYDLPHPSEHLDRAGRRALADRLGAPLGELLER